MNNVDMFIKFIIIKIKPFLFLKQSFCNEDRCPSGPLIEKAKTVDVYFLFLIFILFWLYSEYKCIKSLGENIIVEFLDQEMHY